MSSFKSRAKAFEALAGVTMPIASCIVTHLPTSRASSVKYDYVARAGANDITTICLSTIIPGVGALIVIWCICKRCAGSLRTLVVQESEVDEEPIHLEMKEHDIETESSRAKFETVEDEDVEDRATFAVEATLEEHLYGPHVSHMAGTYGIPRISLERERIDVHVCSSATCAKCFSERQKHARELCSSKGASNTGGALIEGVGNERAPRGHLPPRWWEQEERDEE